MSAVITATDNSFIDAITDQDKPVLTYFCDRALEQCEFMDLVINEIARERQNELKLVKINISESPATQAAFSVPHPPVLMIIRNNTILGYKIGKTTNSAIAGWIDRSLSKNDKDGVPLAQFQNALDTYEQSQNDKAQQQHRAARKKGLLTNAFNIAGGCAIALLFPVSGFGALGLAITTYHAIKTAELLIDKNRTTAPAKSALGKTFEIAGNLATMAGSLGLVAASLPLASTALAIAGVTTGSFMMLSGGLRFGHRAGLYLPLDKILRGSLREHAEERANRDPNKPLAEFDPPNNPKPPKPE